MDKEAPALGHYFLKIQKQPIKIILPLSLIGEGYSLKLGSFQFDSSLSASDISNPIFEIKATEYKIKITTPMLYGSGETSYSLVLWLQAPLLKEVVVGLVIDC